MAKESDKTAVEGTLTRKQQRAVKWLVREYIERFGLTANGCCEEKETLQALKMLGVKKPVRDNLIDTDIARVRLEEMGKKLKARLDEI